ncbi:unnamed protein product [Brachionus calyciflorus]|uniref:Arrestin C-terminal-like domain-containing protein n=1 Tax=Brachionus calyciflorus TaxID=104777 RepID=A0A813RLL0_9BILA|nr:unnamed protein product [Brachionus calyciflorus]
MKYFSIKLNKEIPIYSGGETLKGTLSFGLIEKLKINSVKLRIVGKAKVQWTHGEATYRDVEKYIDVILFFLKKEADNDLYIQPGDYSYPFEVKLPENAPTSFEHLNGRIRYSIKGTIDIPWAFDKHTKKSFSVLSHVDLNDYANVKQPYGVSAQKTLCCGPCSSKPITVTFSVSKIGHVPGEPILFNVSVVNQTRKEIKQMKVTLMQNLRFEAKSRVRNCTRKVASMEFPNKVGIKTTEKWNNLPILIPSVSPSTMGNSRLIDVSYELFLNFDATGVSTSTDLNVPIVIGTIPLRKGNKIGNTDLPFLLEECVFEPDPIQIKENEQKQKRREVFETDANTFKPLYPYYKDYTGDEEF